jgi:hypothetical protein
MWPCVRRSCLGGSDRLALGAAWRAAADVASLEPSSLAAKATASPVAQAIVMIAVTTTTAGRLARSRGSSCELVVPVGMGSVWVGVVECVQPGYVWFRHMPDLGVGSFRLACPGLTASC